jgi:glucose uptake protein GlcU
MTRWGMILLVAYVALGLSPMAQRKAIHLGAVLTAIVLAFVMAKMGAAR